MSFIFKNHKAEVLAKVSDEMEKALTMCGQTAVSYAKNNLRESGAVDTGLLRNSITYAISGKNAALTDYKATKGDNAGAYEGTASGSVYPTVYIGTNVEYAPYIEFGTGAENVKGGREGGWRYKDAKGQWYYTKGMAARPYIKPAVSDHQATYKKIFEMCLGKIK